MAIDTLRLGIFLAAGLVTAGFAVKAAQVTWHLAGQTGGSMNAMPSTPAAPAADARTDVDAIIALEPFGTASAPVADLSPARETSLGLELLGVVAAEEGGRSSAVIRESGGTAETYSIGDEIPGGARLTAVAADHVVLSVAGRRESLSFPDALARGTSGSSPRGVAAMRARLSPDAQRTAGGSGSATSERDAFLAAAGKTPARDNDSALSADQIIDSFRQQIEANPQTVLDNLGVAVSGEGYRVSDGASSDLRRAGLKPGDVVVSVNGSSVGNIEQDRALFEQVVASGRARVEIMRDGRRMTLCFPLQ